MAQRGMGRNSDQDERKELATAIVAAANAMVHTDPGEIRLTEWGQLRAAVLAAREAGLVEAK